MPTEMTGLRSGHGERPVLWAGAGWVRQAAVVLLTVLVAGVTLALPAAAARLSVPDDRGDAVRPVDMTRLVVNNSDSSVRVKARVPHFRPARTELVYVVLRVRAKNVPATDYTLITSRAGGTVSGDLWEVPFASEFPPGAEPVECPDLTVRWVRDRAAVAVIPRSCLVTTAKVRAGVLVERQDASRPRHSDWAPGPFASLSSTVRRG